MKVFTSTPGQMLNCSIYQDLNECKDYTNYYDHGSDITVLLYVHQMNRQEKSVRVFVFQNTVSTRNTGGFEINIGKKV